MSPQKKVKNSQAQKRTSQGRKNDQTNLLAWKTKEDLSNSKSISIHENNPVEDYELADDLTENALQLAVSYLGKGKKGGFPYESHKTIPEFVLRIFKGKHIFLFIHAFVYLIDIY